MSGRYRRSYELLKVLRETDAITNLEYAATMATVASVIEDNKIAIGLNLECSLGLQTSRLVNEHVLSWCYSPQLHEVCLKAQGAGPKFVDSIIPSLRAKAANDSRISSEFVDLYQVQFDNMSNTLDIHCNVTVHHTLNVIGAGAYGNSPGLALTTLAATLTLMSLFGP